MVPKICSVDGCEGTHKARGWCSMHYLRWQRYGDITVVHKPGSPASTEVPKCLARSCGQDADVLSRSLCAKHYSRWLRHGDPDRTIKSPPNEPIQDRLARRSRKEGECISFTILTSKGYGRILHDGRHQFAHRVAWELKNGPIPAGIEIDHICHNHACINVSHLRLATRKQNNENRKGAQSNSASGVRGVVWNKKSKKWQAAVQHNGKKYHLGLFEDLNEADHAASAKRMELFTHSQN